MQMQRRELIRNALGFAAVATGATRAGAAPGARNVPATGCVVPQSRERDRVRVGFLISNGATVIDFCGPWEVFQDVTLPGMPMQRPFELYTVAEAREPVRVTGGMRIIPDFSIEDAPLPQVLVVPAMRGSEATRDWIRKVSAVNHLTMSVCTGAFQLGRAGLLEGLSATTHHDYHESFARDFPGVRLVRNARFVEDGRIATAAGVTAGVDLALRVVERYYGREVAETTARYMAHESEVWKVATKRSSRVQVVA
jgi:transcriptional regulator GlxA family with amidase domain